MDLPSPLRVRQSDIPFPDAAHNLCVISESQLTLKEQVNDLCQLAYLEIGRIGSVRQYVSFEATGAFTSSLVLSGPAYCLSLIHI